jgi:hypothetical protein
VLTGEMDKGTAVVINQLFNSLLRSIELERHLDAQREIEDRLTELEAALDRKGVTGGWQWGTHNRPGWRE